MTDPQEIFETAFCQSGSVSVNCRCGRTHIADDEFHYLEEQEQKDTREYEAKNPEKVVHHDCDSISWAWFGEDQIVFGCTCKSDEKIMNLLLEKRSCILDFYKRMAVVERESFERAEQKLKEAEEAIEAVDRQ